MRFVQAPGLMQGQGLLQFVVVMGHGLPRRYAPRNDIWMSSRHSGRHRERSVAIHDSLTRKMLCRQLPQLGFSHRRHSCQCP